MAVNLTEKRADELLEIDGIRLFTGRAGIKQQDRDDLTLMVLGGGHTVGAVFTQNRFCAAPVHIAKSHLFDQDGVCAWSSIRAMPMRVPAHKAVWTRLKCVRPWRNRSAANPIR